MYSFKKAFFLNFSLLFVNVKCYILKLIFTLIVNTLGAKQGGHKGQDQGRDREESQRREGQFQDAKQEHD